MGKRIMEVVAYRGMLWRLITADLRARYKGSVLGFLWTFLNPLLTLLVYTLVYSFILRMNIPHYSAFLLVGLLAWNLFSASVQASSRVILSQASIVKKIYFPREVLPLSVVGASLINYLFSLAILFPYLFINGIHLHWTWVAFPVILLIELLQITGLSLIVAAVNVYLRDVEHVLNILMMILFYLTPIFYSLQLIPKHYQVFFKLNPMASVIIDMQNILFYGQAIPWKLTLYGGVLSILLFTTGWVVFARLNVRLAEEV
jgi:lipopolysaccharide transport system permease protein